MIPACYAVLQSHLVTVRSGRYPACRKRTKNSLKEQCVKHFRDPSPQNPKLEISGHESCHDRIKLYLSFYYKILKRHFFRLCPDIIFSYTPLSSPSRATSLTNIVVSESAERITKEIVRVENL